MRITLACVVVALIAIAAWVRSISQNVTELSKSQQALSAKVNDKASNSGLELQAKCSEQARKVFVDLGWSKNQLAGYENHYNASLNKCFIQIQDSDAKSSPGTIWINKTVSDAFEGKTYGTYSWHTEKDKKYWEVPPFECHVTLQSGETKTCKSDTEFDELVKVYMQGGH